MGPSAPSSAPGADDAAAIVERHTDRLGWRRDLPHVARALELVGQAGSRWRVPTPALVVDLDRLVGNLHRMGALVAGRAALRPHAKSHKSAAIAELQLGAGAVGVCCAKLGEAEALSAAGIGAILVTSPLDPGAVADRLVAWLRATAAPAVVVDRVDAVAPLDRLAAQADRRLDVLVDIDVGLGRTGVADAATAAQVAARVAGCAHLGFVGVQAYGGHWQHLPTREERRQAVEAGMRGPSGLAAAVTAIETAVGPVAVRTGGGTGTLVADCDLGALNELQPGSYVFMDRQYRDALVDEDAVRFDVALTVQATVISANGPGWVTVDAGLKAFATDAGPPVPLAVGADGRFTFFGDEHGMLTGAVRPSVGERVEFLAPHCDPTVDRYDVMHVVRGDRLIGVAPVDGRGRSQ